MSNQKLREMLGLEPVREMIRKRRLQWVAHSARRGQGDYTWRDMRREVEDEESGWGEQMRRDWNEMEMRDVEHWMHLVENKTWLSRKLKAMSSAGDEGEMAHEGEEGEADE